MPTRTFSTVLADQLASRGESSHRYAQRLGISPSQFSRLDQRPISRSFAKTLINDPMLSTAQRREMIVAILEHWMDALGIDAADRPLVTMATSGVQEAGPTLEVVRLQRSLRENPKLISLLRNILDLVE